VTIKKKSGKAPNGVQHTGNGGANMQKQARQNSGKSKPFSSDIVDDIDSLAMPARDQFIISLIVDRIERGEPSFCDDVERC
jgi:hypothetical protein